MAVVLPFLAATVSACGGALAPAGAQAEAIAELFWIMALAGTLIWIAVMALAAYASRTSSPRSNRKGLNTWLLAGCGVVAPAVVLAILLVFGLRLLWQLAPPANANQETIRVHAERWWWRIQYSGFDSGFGGDGWETANEIYLPVGRAVDLHLQSDNVIHSLWVPALAGKMDAIPGRTTRLSLKALRPGVFRGVCAEYCGRGHTHMDLSAVALPQDQFETWLATQAVARRTPKNVVERQGEQAFIASGCGACHRVRGTAANGRIGPDLTHVGSRKHLAGGLLRPRRSDFATWMVNPEAHKPGVQMPPYHMLPAHVRDAIAAYLESLT